MRTILSLCLALAASVAMVQLVAQPTSDKDKQKKEKQGKQTKQEESLFSKPIGAKGGSKGTKESATLAFNGIDPSGRVNAAVLGAAPGAAEAEKANQMTDHIPRHEVLLAFEKKGGLKTL